MTTLIRTKKGGDLDVYDSITILEKYQNSENQPCALCNITVGKQEWVSEIMMETILHDCNMGNFFYKHGK